MSCAAATDRAGIEAVMVLYTIVIRKIVIGEFANIFS